MSSPPPSLPMPMTTRRRASPSSVRGLPKRVSSSASSQSSAAPISASARSVSSASVSPRSASPPRSRMAMRRASRVLASRSRRMRSSRSEARSRISAPRSGKYAREAGRARVPPATSSSHAPGRRSICSATQSLAARACSTACLARAGSPLSVGELSGGVTGRPFSADSQGIGEWPDTAPGRHGRETR